MGINAKSKLYERVAVPIALYGAETWSKAVGEKKRLYVMELRCLMIMWRNLYGPSEK